MVSTIVYLGIFFLLTNSILFSQRSYLKKRSLRVFVIYLYVTLIIQIFSWILMTLKTPNLYLSHFYFISQFILLSLFYKKIIKNVKVKSLISLLLLVVLLIMSYRFISDPDIFYKFSLFEVILCSIPIVVYSIFYFMESFGIEHKKYLILNSGVFIYLLSSTLIFSSGNLMPDLPKSVNRIVWIFNAILYLIYQILIFVEWYKNFRKPEALEE